MPKTNAGYMIQCFATGWRRQNRNKDSTAKLLALVRWVTTTPASPTVSAVLQSSQSKDAMTTRVDNALNRLKIR